MICLHPRVASLSLLIFGASFGSAHAGKKYTIQEGDNLWTVARKFDTRVKPIAHLNGLDPSKPVKPGTVIQLPADAKTPTANPKAPVAKPTKPVKGAPYTVRNGESAWVIARRFSLKTGELLAANGLDEKKHLKPGQKIVIPGAKAASTKSAPTKRGAPTIVKRLQKPAAYAVVQRRAPLYARADQDSHRVRLVKRGKRLSVIGRQSNWLKIQLSAGEIVWIPAKLAELESPRTVAKKLESAAVAVIAQTKPALEPAKAELTATEEAKDVQQLAGELKNDEQAAEQVAVASQLLLAKLLANDPKPLTAPAANGKYATHGLKYLGTPYRRGGLSSRGLDCSGLVCRVLKDFGKNAPHNAAALFKTGTPIKKNDLKAGDLVFFQNTYRRGISHVGIFIGNGKFVHASTRGRRVRVTSLSEAYYIRHWAGARRVK